MRFFSGKKSAYTKLPDQDELFSVPFALSGTIEKKSFARFGWRWRKRAVVLSSTGRLIIYKYYLEGIGAGKPNVGRVICMKTAKSVKVTMKNEITYIRIVDRNYKEVNLRVRGKEARQWGAKMFLYHHHFIRVPRSQLIRQWTSDKLSPVSTMGDGSSSMPEDEYSSTTSASKKTCSTSTQNGRLSESATISVENIKSFPIASTQAEFTKDFQCTTAIEFSQCMDSSKDGASNSFEDSWITLRNCYETDLKSPYPTNPYILANPPHKDTPLDDPIAEGLPYKNELQKTAATQATEVEIIVTDKVESDMKPEITKSSKFMSTDETAGKRNENEMQMQIATQQSGIPNFNSSIAKNNALDPLLPDLTNNSANSYRCSSIPVILPTIKEDDELDSSSVKYRQKTKKKFPFVKSISNNPFYCTNSAKTLTIPSNMCKLLLSNSYNQPNMTIDRDIKIIHF